MKKIEDNLMREIVRNAHGKPMTELRTFQELSIHIKDCEMCRTTSAKMHRIFSEFSGILQKNSLA